VDTKRHLFAVVAAWIVAQGACSSSDSSPPYFPVESSDAGQDTGIHGGSGAEAGFAAGGTAGKAGEASAGSGGATGGSGGTAGDGCLIFDGTFTASDVTLSALYAKWSFWQCAPQPDSLEVVSVSSLGRAGYAARFTQRPGPTYDCGGNAHDQIARRLPTVPRPHREIWVGWSEYLDPSFTLGNADADWLSWGFGGFASTFKHGGLGNTGITRQFWGAGNIESKDVMLGVNTDFYHIKLQNGYQRGVWQDWMYHILWAHDDTGFVEVHRRVEGEGPDYSMIGSKYDFATEYIGFDGQTADNNELEVRAGPYRLSSVNATQISYVYEPKIGTTMATVAYGPDGKSPSFPLCD
jgi:hypothetical protein